MIDCDACFLPFLSEETGQGGAPSRSDSLPMYPLSLHSFNSRFPIHEKFLVPKKHELGGIVFRISDFLTRIFKLLLTKQKSFLFPSQNICPIGKSGLWEDF